MAIGLTPGAINTDMWEGVKYAIEQNKQMIFGIPGLTYSDPTLNIASGETFRWTVSDYLTDITLDAVNMTDTADLNYVTTREMKGVVLARGKVLAENILQQMKQGTQNPALAEQIAQQLMGIFQNNYQIDMAAAIKGAFLAATSTDLKRDLGANRLTPDAIRETFNIRFPNKQDDHNKVILVHADVYQDLMDNSGSTYNLKDQIIVEGGVPKLAGLSVYKNSTICQKIDNGDGTYDYTSYMCADNAFLLNQQMTPQVFSQEVVTIGGKTDVYSLLGIYAVAPNGASYIGTITDNETPTATDLATGTNWKWVYQNSEDIPITEIRSLIPAA